MTKRKVIVTGGAGFIGSHTYVELHAAGFVPVIVDDLRNSTEGVIAGLRTITGADVTHHCVDCCDPQAMAAVFKAEGPIYGVIHFAADKAVGESVADPLKYYHNNLGSLTVLLDVMREQGVQRIVFSSSCTVYGEPAVLPVAESAPDDRATSPYGATKVFGERILRDQSVAQPELRAVLLRYFNPVGAHASALIGELPIGVPNNLVPFVTQTAAGLREKLTVFGNDYATPDGTCIRDYIHVVDLAKAHVRALEWMEGADERCAVFNIGTGKGNTVLDVIKGFEAATGVKVPYVIGPRRAGDVPVVFAATERSREVLGWSPVFDLRQALADAWRWQQALAERSA